jgi:hypothetical protein
MIRILLLLMVALAAAPAAHAAGEATNGPNADSSPAQRKSAPAGTAACPDRPAPNVGNQSAVIVALEPDTLWRPRGAEVRFTIQAPSGPADVKSVRVCFGWSSPDGDHSDTHALSGSPQVRSVTNDTGTVEYGATVPHLKDVAAGNWWLRRFLDTGHYVFTGVFIVPVADMVVAVTLGSGDTILSSIQVGVTAVSVAWAVVAVVLVLLWAAMAGIARYRKIAGRNLLLRIISTQDGYASLSQMQIVLWTFVVGMSAIYVMVLSGNLISITPGTLTLLGIASGAALIARVPPATSAGAVAPSGTTTQQEPEWSDLIISDRQVGEIDVTRLQMLAFTLITASFVLIKVVVDYEIPEIPSNFLVLMGISNGVYVTGRSLPSKPRDVGK